MKRKMLMTPVNIGTSATPRSQRLTPVPPNTRSHHTSALLLRRSSPVLAAELAGYRSGECLRVDRECRRRCDPESASRVLSPALDCSSRDHRHLHQSTYPADIR